MVRSTQLATELSIQAIAKTAFAQRNDLPQGIELAHDRPELCHHWPSLESPDGLYIATGSQLTASNGKEQ